MADSLPLSLKVEGFLFYKATPQKKTLLCKSLEVTAEELGTALEELKARQKDSALQLLETDTELQLVTISELDPMIESIRKDDLKRDIGKAGAETLAIVLYRAPISRVEIDRIRGVNSGFILRNLLVRGLIDRTASGRTTTYTVTPTLLSHLGISSVHDLPNHGNVLDQLEQFEAELAEAEAL